MNGFERRREKKKENIRLAALELFKQRGLKKVSVNDIAKQAEVSPVSIYNYFGSKENLVSDAIKWFVINMVDKFQAILEGTEPYMKRLERLVVEKSELLQLYNNGVIQLALSTDPKMVKFIDDVISKRSAAIMGNFLAEGKKLGYISPNISPEGFMLYMEMYRNIMYSHPEMLGKSEKGQRLMAQVWQLYMYGLMGKEIEPDPLISLHKKSAKDASQA